MGLLLSHPALTRFMGFPREEHLYSPRGRAQLEILCLTQVGIFLCIFINDDLIISIGFVISYILAKISCRKSVGGSLTESVLDTVGVQS